MLATVMPMSLGLLGRLRVCILRVSEVAGLQELALEFEALFLRQSAQVVQQARADEYDELGGRVDFALAAEKRADNGQVAQQRDFAIGFLALALDEAADDDGLAVACADGR